MDVLLIHTLRLVMPSRSLKVRRTTNLCGVGQNRDWLALTRCCNATCGLKSFIDNQRELWHTVPILFPIPHRPTKLLIEPAACKSLKILEVGSRALASLLITERGICGNRAGNRAAAEATLATSLQFSLGNRQKKSQPIRVGTLSIGGAGGNRTPVRKSYTASTTYLA